MTILVQQLREEIEQLKAENFSLRDALADKVVDSTKLRAFLPADGGFTIGLEGGPCALLADAFGEQLYTSNAINYLQLTFTSGAYPDLGQIVVTLQRCTGKTPHELRIDAEQEREQLKAENAELKSAKHTVECRFEVSEDTLSCIRGCLRAAEGDIDQLKAESSELRRILQLAVTLEGPLHYHERHQLWDGSGNRCAWCAVHAEAQEFFSHQRLAMTKEKP